MDLKKYHNTRCQTLIWQCLKTFWHDYSHNWLKVTLFQVNEDVSPLIWKCSGQNWRQNKNPKKTSSYLRLKCLRLSWPGRLRTYTAVFKNNNNNLSSNRTEMSKKLFVQKMISGWYLVTFQWRKCKTYKWESKTTNKQKNSSCVYMYQVICI